MKLESKCFHSRTVRPGGQVDFTKLDPAEIILNEKTIKE